MDISPARIRGRFVRWVAEVSGQDLNLCYQCGKCSAGCPMAFVMDLLPNQVIRAVQLGLEEDLAASRTPRLCAACMACTVRCPKGIDIAAVMEALRQVFLRKNIDFVDPSSMAPEAIASLPQIAIVSGFRKLTG